MILDLYKSEKPITLPIKEVYTDKNGYPNEKAFYHFLRKKKDMIKEKPYCIVCINIDLRKANAQSYTFGDYVLRKVVTELSDYYIFRIQGEKFNILVEQDRLNELKCKLDEPNENYEIYYGTINKPFNVDSDEDIKTSVKEAVALMFEHKCHKHNNEKGIIGDKGNTPPELRETTTKKYRNTMWYSVVKVQITEPSFDEFTVYVFPTELKQPLQSIPSVVVLYDNMNYRVFYSNNVTFGKSDVLFTVTARFDREGHLNTAIYNTGGKCQYKIDTHEGVCIPVNFGKRIAPTKEIYPIRKNLQGYCDYVLFERGNVTLNTEGIVTSASGTQYGVFMDNTAIDLVKLETTKDVRSYEQMR